MHNNVVTKNLGSAGVTAVLLGIPIFVAVVLLQVRPKKKKERCPQIYACEHSQGFRVTRNP
jgi:hypothetical protein